MVGKEKRFLTIFPEPYSALSGRKAFPPWGSLSPIPGCARPYIHELCLGSVSIVGLSLKWHMYAVQSIDLCVEYVITLNPFHACFQICRNPSPPIRTHHYLFSGIRPLKYVQPFLMKAPSAPVIMEPARPFHHGSLKFMAPTNQC